MFASYKAIRTSVCTAELYILIIIKFCKQSKYILLSRSLELVYMYLHAQLSWFWPHLFLTLVWASTLCDVATNAIFAAVGMPIELSENYQNYTFPK